MVPGAGFGVGGLRDFGFVLTASPPALKVICIIIAGVWGFTLRLKIAPKPYIVWSLGPKALKYESLEP